MMWLVFALASALLSAAAAVIQKKILFRMTALEFSFSVSALILLVSALVPLSMDVGALPSQTLVLILGKSALGACAFLLVMLSLEKNQISSALPLLGLTPAAAAFLSMPALGESLQFREWAAIALMIGGTFLIEKKPAAKYFVTVHDPAALKAHLPIVGALVLFAVSSVADKLLVSTYRIHPLIVLFYQHIVYCLIFGAMLVLREVFRRTFASPLVQPDAPAAAPPPFGGARILQPFMRKRTSRPSGGPRMTLANAQAQDGPFIRSFLGTCLAQLPLIAAVALITIAYRVAQLEATKDAPAALVLAVKRTSIVFASLYGGRLFSDERLTAKCIGAALIAGAGFFILRFIA
jgi:drug/metabolite transporter (DMT)-like permease